MFTSTREPLPEVMSPAFVGNDLPFRPGEHSYPRPALTSPTISGSLSALIALADGALKNGVADRDDPQGTLQTIVLAALKACVIQARCVDAIVSSGNARGALPNVRVMFEFLVTVRYVADPTVTETEVDRRLERYYRGVRRAQVKLRDALDPYPELKASLAVDTPHAKTEKAEYESAEKALPKAKRLGDRHWSGEPGGLKGLAEMVGLGSDYAFLYRISSGLAHANRPWDEVSFDASLALVLPKAEGLDEFAGAIALDAIRYLGWILTMAYELHVVPLYRSQQAEITPLRKFLKPLEVLFEEKLIGAGDS